MKTKLKLVSILVICAATLAHANTLTKSWSADGDSAGDNFGYHVRGAGDVNRDGYADLIVGAYSDDNNGTDSGSVRVLSGRDGKVLYTFNGDAAKDHLGISVSGAGDVNKDGYPDLIAGAPNHDKNGGDSGIVKVYSGKNGAVLYRFYGGSAGDFLGRSVDGAGDVNADGYDDVVVGAHFADHLKFGDNAGSVTVYSGKDGKVLHTFYGNYGSLLGTGVGGAGDVNADGYDDVVMGGFQDNSQGTNGGMVLVCSGKDGKTLHTLYGAAGAYFGLAVSKAGDVNKDGYADFVVGAPDDGPKLEGRAYVYSGKDGSVLHTFTGVSSVDSFGAAVSGGGDVDGDGYVDVMVGAPQDDDNGTSSGSAWVFSGKDGTKILEVHGASKGDGAGIGVAIAGDLSGNGRADIAYGAWTADDNGTDAGRVIVYTCLAPTGSVSINEDAEATNSSSVTLSLAWKAVGADVESLRLRNSGGNWSEWEDLSAARSWTLVAGEGTRVVEAQFLDGDGLTSAIFEDSVIVDQTPPTGSVEIERGASWTLSAAVDLNLEYTDLQTRVADVRLRNVGGLWSNWQGISDTVSWTLTSGEGVRTVEAEFRDAAGNVSDLAADSIEVIHDPTPPGIDQIMVSGSGRLYLLPEERFELQVLARDNHGGTGVASFCTSLDYGSTWSDWIPANGSYLGAELQKPGNDGLVEVRVKVRDGAGNESAAVADRIYLVAEPLPYLGAGAKASGAITAPLDVDAKVLDLAAGDLLNVKASTKSESGKAPLDLALDLARPTGKKLITGKYPTDAKSGSILGFAVPETGRYLLVLRRDGHSDAERGSYKLKVKVKQARANKKVNAEFTGTEIPFEAVAGSKFKASVKGEGVEVDGVSLIGPDGPVAIEVTGKPGKVKIRGVVLTAGTGTYVIRLANPATVTAKWSVKLPKIKGTVPE